MKIIWHNKKVQKIVALVLLLMWLGVIFAFSHQGGNESNAHSGWYIDMLGRFIDISNDRVLWWVTFLVRKVAHMILFFCLSVITFFFFELFQKKTCRWYPVAAYVFWFCVVIASLDELHQWFIPDRHAQVSDILIDSIGILAGLASVRVYFYFKNRNR